MDTTSSAEQVLNLFDSFWFHQQIITKQPSLPLPLPTPDHKIEVESLKPVISRLPSSHHVRSLSDQFSSQTCFSSNFSSSESVLIPHKLQTVHSGKEVTQENITQEKLEEKEEKPKMRRKKIGSSKSLSDLEFEELKGFIDLGFVFSEEDKNSSLVSIIPGLQRLGGKKDEENKQKEEEEENVIIPRPYLSEAWDLMETEKKENPLMNWRIPSLNSDVDMKLHLRNWAHSVASTVR